MQLAREMATLLVLQRDQLPRQLAAFGKRGVEAFGEMIEDVADGGEFGEVERRQSRGEVVGEDAVTRTPVMGAPVSSNT